MGTRQSLDSTPWLINYIGLALYSIALQDGLSLTTFLWLSTEQHKGLVNFDLKMATLVTSNLCINFEHSKLQKEGKTDTQTEHNLVSY